MRIVFVSFSLLSISCVATTSRRNFIDAKNKPTYQLVVLFCRNNPADSPARVRDIARIPRNKVHMDMKDALASCCANIYSDIVPIWMILYIHNSLHVIR